MKTKISIKILRIVENKIMPTFSEQPTHFHPPHAKIPYRSCRHVKWQNKSPTPAPVQLLSQRDIITGGTYSRVRRFYPYIIIQLLPWTADQTRSDQLSIGIIRFNDQLNSTENSKVVLQRGAENGEGGVGMELISFVNSITFNQCSSIIVIIFQRLYDKAIRLD